jgi:hypothetical protein
MCLKTNAPQSGCVESQDTETLSFGSYVELVLTIWLSVTNSLRIQAVTMSLKTQRTQRIHRGKSN